MAQDYYKILGIERTANTDEIKKAYRKLAVKYHPDKNQGNKAAEEKFKEINEANDVLSDPEKRKKYDQFGENWAHFQEGGNQAYGGNPFGQQGRGGYSYSKMNEEDFQNAFGGEGNFSDFFQNIFGGGGRKSRGRNWEDAYSQQTFSGQDYNAELEITLAEAYNGTNRQFTINGNSMSIKLKPGIKDGQVLKLKGKGGPGIQGGTPGDLFLNIKVNNDTLFERKEDDLYVDVHIDLYTAILGGKVEVRTIDGGVLKVDIPEETQNDRVLRLRGKGMSFYNQSEKKGDLYVKIKVDLPTHLSTKEKELFRELNTIRK